MKIRYKNKTYKSINQLCKKLKISRSAVSTRMRKGETLKNAIKSIKEVKGIREIKLKYRGKTYIGYKELADDLDLGKNTLREKAKVMGLAKAIKYCQGINENEKHSKYCMMYNGKEYRTIQELIEEYKVSYYDFKRFYQETKSITKALQKSQDIKKKIKLNGEEYRFYQQVIDEYGITDYQSFYGILKKEKDLEIAIEGTIIKEFKEMLKNNKQGRK